MSEWQVISVALLFAAGVYIGKLIERKQARQKSTEGHRCDEFTRWTNCREDFAMVDPNDGHKLYDKTVYWQERYCTICGLVQQHGVEWPVDDDRYDDDGDDDDETPLIPNPSENAAN